MSEFAVRCRFRARDVSEELEQSVGAKPRHCGLDNVFAAHGSNHGLDGRRVDDHGVEA